MRRIKQLLTMFAVEAKALERFKAEFARLQGPTWRGTSF